MALAMPMRGPATISAAPWRANSSKGGGIERKPVVGAGDFQRLAEPPGSGAKQPFVGHSPPSAHGREADARLDRAQEHGAGRALGLADEIQAPVNAVGAVDIGVAGRAEHHRIAVGWTAITVRCGIGVVIGLDFDDPSARAVEEQRRSDQSPEQPRARCG